MTQEERRSRLPQPGQLSTGALSCLPLYGVRLNVCESKTRLKAVCYVFCALHSSFSVPLPLGMQLPPTALSVPADGLARTTTQSPPPSPPPSPEEPPCTQQISAGTKVMTMPELTHIIQRFLTPQHLVSAALICQAWHRAWIPILWRDLSFIRPHTTPLDHDYYFLSAECLLRHGHHVRTLRASLLTTPELLRLSQHCSHLHAVTLQRAVLSLKSLRQFLCATPGLRTFDLEWDWNLNDGYPVDHETPAGTDANTDADTEDTNSDTDIERDSETYNWIKTIECSASPHLEDLVLRPHPSMKVLAMDLRSLFKTLTCLRTVQLYEVDVEERLVRRPKRRSGKERRQKHREDSNERDSGSAQQTLEGPSGSQMNAVVASSPSSSIGTTLSEAASSLEQQHVNDIFRLEFLSIHSSTTTTLAQLLQGCTHLRVLHLHRCEHLKDAALEAIAQYAPSVSDIALSTCRNLSSVGLQHFLRTQTRTRLEHVHFQDLSAVDDETLTILATSHGERLRKLVIYYCSHFTDRGVQALLSAATRLKSLTLQSHRLTLALFFNPWACAPTLEYLELDGRFRRPIMVSSIGRAPPKEVVPCATLQNRFRTLTQLKDLRIWAGGMGNDLLQGFGPDVRIETLGLYWMSPQETFSMEWATVRTSLPYLKRLYCELWETKGDLRALLAPLNVKAYQRCTPAVY